MTSTKPKSRRLRYTRCLDALDALDLARMTGGAVLAPPSAPADWRCYTQVNRLYLDFPHLRPPAPCFGSKSAASEPPASPRISSSGSCMTGTRRVSPSVSK